MGKAAFGRLFLWLFRFFDYTFPGGSGEKCNFSPTIEILCMFSSEPLFTVEDMYMAEMYAELLDGVAARVAGMARSGLPAVNDEEAREFGRRVADMLAEDWGGSSIYIPKNLAARFRKRDATLYREFTGNNIAELAQKYGLTQQRVYAILKAERARRGSGQLRFPGL